MPPPSALASHSSLAAISVRSSLAAQRDELQDLRGEMAQLGSTVGGLLGSAGKALAQIRNEKEELERHNAMLKASLAARERSSQQASSRDDASHRDAELARLKGEVGRLRAAAVAKEAVERESAAEMEELERRLQQAELTAREAQRQAAQAGASVPQSELVAAKSLLEAREAEVLRLQEEAEAAARSHQARLAEIQDSCHAKIRELRRVHEEQLAAASQAGQASESGADAERERLQQRARAAQSDADEARRALADAQQARGSAEAEASRLRDAVRGAKAEVAALQEDVLRLNRAAEEAEQRAGPAQAGAPSAPPASPPIGADMLAMMEAQLGSLSGLIRQKDAEIAGLKATVQQQCDERVEMLMALNEASKAGAGGAGAGGVGVGKGKAAQGEEEGPPGKGRGRGVSNTIRGNIGAAPGSPWRRKAGGWH